MSKSLDGTDREILRILQRKGRISNVELSREIGLSPAPTLERVRKLERNNFIKGYAAKVNERMLGITVQAFVQVTLVRQDDVRIHRFVEEISKVPEVAECHQVTGEFDYLLKVFTRDISALDKLLTGRLGQLQEVGHIKSHIVLNTLKEEPYLPLYSELKSIQGWQS